MAKIVAGRASPYPFISKRTSEPAELKTLREVPNVSRYRMKQHFKIISRHGAAEKLDEGFVRVGEEAADLAAKGFLQERERRSLLLPACLDRRGDPFLSPASCRRAVSAEHLAADNRVRNACSAAKFVAGKSGSNRNRNQPGPYCDRCRARTLLRSSARTRRREVNSSNRSTFSSWAASRADRLS